MHILNRIAKIIFVLALAAFVFFYFKTRMDDRIAPVISMEEDEISVSIDSSEKKLLDGVTAEDNKDGDLTDRIILENLSNFTKPGQRVATYAVFDSSGNLARASRVVKYKDYVAPHFIISSPMILPTSAISGTSPGEEVKVALRRKAGDLSLGLGRGVRIGSEYGASGSIRANDT